MTTLITRMQEIVLEINSKLDTIQTTSLEVGSLLNEANEEMKEQGLKSVEFLAWCKAEFSIGKSQVYRLMKVASFFKNDKRFEGVAMRVLYVLATEATDTDLEKAAEFAASGTLNSAVLDTLLNPVKVKQVEELQPVKKTVKEIDAQQADIDAALANIPESEARSYDTEIEASAANVVHAIDAVMSVDLDMVASLQATIDELRNALKQSNDMLADLKVEKVQHNTTREMPMLPQFKNACPYAVLGLGQMEAKKKPVVNKAFRELVKLGYGNGHPAFELLTKAKELLIADIEA